MKLPLIVGEGVSNGRSGFPEPFQGPWPTSIAYQEQQNAMILALLSIVAVIAPFGAPQSLNAQLHNASATGDVQQLANLVAKLRAADPKNYLSRLSNCFEGPPKQCTADSRPPWCGAYSVFPSSGGPPDECSSGDSWCPVPCGRSTKHPCS